MAHALSIRENGKVEFAFTGDRSAIWHSLGNVIPDDATPEQWKVAAGMDWSIQRSKVRFVPSLGADPTVWDDYHVLLRSDTKAPLAVVSDSFKVVQPGEVIDFFHDLIDAAGFKMTTAGVLHGGRKFWAQADIGDGDDVVRGDFVGARLLLATACDGSMNTIAKGVSERVVCANTLGFAMSEKGGSIVRVSHRSEFNADRVKEQLGLAPAGFARFIKQARELSKLEVSPPAAKQFVLTLLGGVPVETVAADAERNEKVRESSGYKTILALFEGQGRGSSLPGVRGTAWGLVNGVTEYVDHFQRARSSDNKFDSSQFGAGDELKTKAFDKAVELLAA